VLAERLAPRRRPGVELARAEAGEDVRRERRRPRPGRAELAVDRLGEIGGRRARDDERRDGGHRLLRQRDRAAHRLELLRRLAAAELVDERRAGAEALGAEDARQVERGLGPDALADRDALRLAEAADDALKDGDPVVLLV